MDGDTKRSTKAAVRPIFNHPQQKQQAERFEIFAVWSVRLAPRLWRTDPRRSSYMCFDSQPLPCRTRPRSSDECPPKLYRLRCSNCSTPCRAPFPHRRSSGRGDERDAAGPADAGGSGMTMLPPKSLHLERKLAGNWWQIIFTRKPISGSSTLLIVFSLVSNIAGSCIALCSIWRPRSRGRCDSLRGTFGRIWLSVLIIDGWIGGIGAPGIAARQAPRDL